MLISYELNIYSGFRFYSFKWCTFQLVWWCIFQLVYTVIRIQTDASPFFSSLVFFKKKSTLNELLFIFLQFLVWTKVGNRPRFLDTQNIANQ